MTTLTFYKPAQRSHRLHKKTLGTVLLATLLLSACTDGTDTGGGAGDTASNTDAVELIAPLVGLYDLPANWAGVPYSEAYLEIQAPDDSGAAIALLYRVNDLSNCIEPRPAQGDVTKDPFFDRVFLDGLFEFDRAVLNRAGTSLIINLPEDVQDIDDDGDFSEATSLTAERINMMASDLGETCQ